MTRKTKLFLGAAAIAVIIAGAAFTLIDQSPNKKNEVAATASQAAENGEEHEEGGVVKMTAAERQVQGVVTAPTDMRVLADEAVVPGEVTLDLYRSAQIAPRISAQIVARQVKLGDRVKTGQALVTLSSVEMADAQGNLIVATREWNRVHELGREVVSERRYVEAQVAAEQAQAKLLAFGMTQKQIEALVKSTGASKATGRFDLLAPQDGTVVKDDFVVGEVVDAGRVLFQIMDESRVWVKAQLSSEQAAHVKVGGTVRILVDKDHAVSGRIVQAYHTLDETTRTLPVRIEVDNAGDALHPGQYVNVAVPIGDGKQALAVPESSVTLMDGSPTVFKVEGDKLHPTAIKTGETRGGWIEVAAGLSAGDEIATTEVFLLKSLIQKSQMGEGHGH
ncbi:MAG: efflux RND transporter periplasmic adaptor subunit [Sphingomonadales bacterium]|nr:efflux RND transporter periplasmic adaptor subunit [Sphingomonadales bacterium]